MTKGTTSFGKAGEKGTHIRCRRCGRHSYHVRKKRCAPCGFRATTTLRRHSWQHKKINRTRIVCISRAQAIQQLRLQLWDSRKMERVKCPRCGREMRWVSRL